MNDLSAPFTPWTGERARARGWTPARQFAFIAALERCGVVSRAAAAAAVGMSARTAYRLRDKDGVEGFDRAWRLAQELARIDATANALNIAFEGDIVPVVRKGKLLGTIRRHRLGQQLRVFAAIHRHRAGEKRCRRMQDDRDLRRARARSDRAWRAELAEIDAAEARRQAEYDAELAALVAEGERRRAEARAPRIRRL